ncbi:hypothetical protein PCC7424_5829 (plasmid) [Gloeothece citriformis PCC 7424]|uniref:Uncharacterized protein n=1 Tax=Gloeothece citriformis (strain PCC 7424) TaxID=65393 RepID=B7KM65_GLOC7|nr:hypothetical protein [Gloeothece citriformis]ACK73887.1 hypothetical protein PCC7424_5829 [Gloeothece citriformis PCC 7424]
MSQHSLVLIVFTETTTFNKLELYQLFQIDQTPDIWIKITNEQGCIINHHHSTLKNFFQHQQVIILIPDTIEEEQ